MDSFEFGCLSSFELFLVVSVFFDCSGLCWAVLVVIFCFRSIVVCWLYFCRLMMLFVMFQIRLVWNVSCLK